MSISRSRKEEREGKQPKSIHFNFNFQVSYGFNRFRLQTSKVPNCERDIFRDRPEDKTQYYSRVVGLKDDLSGAQTKPELLKSAEDVVREGIEPSASSGSEEEESSDEDGEGEEGDEKKHKSSARPRDESPNSKKVNLHPHERSLIT